MVRTVDAYYHSQALWSGTAAACYHARGEVTMLLLLMVVLALVVAFGVWRKFGAVQWIWLMFGAAITLVILWALAIVFFIGPEMRRTMQQNPPRSSADEDLAAAYFASA
jgi:hypothetical protein